MKVTIVASRDDIDAGWERSKSLLRQLHDAGVDAYIIDKLGFNSEELHFVATHKVVTTPSVLFLLDDELVARRVGLLAPAQVEAVIKALTTTSPSTM
jgi:hypothetical protein